MRERYQRCRLTPPAPFVEIQHDHHTTRTRCRGIRPGSGRVFPFARHSGEASRRHDQLSAPGRNRQRQQYRPIPGQPRHHHRQRRALHRARAGFRPRRLPLPGSDGGIRREPGGLPGPQRLHGVGTGQAAGLHPGGGFAAHGQRRPGSEEGLL